MCLETRLRPTCLSVTILMNSVWPRGLTQPSVTSSGLHFRRTCWWSILVLRVLLAALFAALSTLFAYSPFFPGIHVGTTRSRCRWFARLHNLRSSIHWRTLSTGAPPLLCHFVFGQTIRALYRLSTK